MQYKMSKYAHKYAIKSFESLKYAAICTINSKYASIYIELPKTRILKFGFDKRIT
jgi:hypothetical protein